jgi:1-acyl-sn-glycerol-3-phosphate acyltransferase
MNEVETVPTEDEKSSEKGLTPRNSSPFYYHSSKDTCISYEFYRLVTYPLVGKILLRICHYGVENIPDEGGLVMASNHQCFLDPMLVGMGSKRKLSFMARASAFKIPLIGRWMTSLGVFPVQRGTADLGAIRKGVEVVSSGQILLVFPEGTRTEDGTIGALKPGCILIAQKAGSPIIPVAIRGAYEAWPRQNKLPWFGKVTVAYGPPIDPGQDREDAKQVQGLLASEIHRLHQSVDWRYET